MRKVLLAMTRSFTLRKVPLKEPGDTKCTPELFGLLERRKIFAVSTKREDHEPAEGFSNHKIHG